ncbi:hypothetical protein CkaCkLH20_06089 [Colletotrichum karsti]|uniref:Uncharacterized protein n=1 Tax=Colletotrichum karsti TaxID=1095194 RepID=A0A9P6I9Y6_9PEZI|nr:uncharacterized protein CkaCkLH20_06089 [Colletotrichum karsti]KAF9876681.1 hypothetical protein CkaCkLH20_06089 [Colletotrichum karsti]
MRLLRSVYSNAEPNTYGKGSWGYTVLRTVYTDESDTLFPLAMERLKLWVVQYYVHRTRFPLWGDRGVRDFIRMKDASVNEELGRRFRIESLEDKEALNKPRLENASHDDVKSLCEYFKKWVISVGGRPEAHEWNPRLYDFLVIDEPCMRVLAALPLRTAPLRVPVDFLEKSEWLRESDMAYVWLIDWRAVERWSGEKGSEYMEDEIHRGWTTHQAIFIADTWFQRAKYMDMEDWIIG